MPFFFSFLTQDHLDSESVLTIIPAREEIAYQFFECSSEDLDSIQETFKKFKLLNPFDPFPISIQTMDNITFKVSSLFFSVLDQQTVKSFFFCFKRRSFFVSSFIGSKFLKTLN